MADLFESVVDAVPGREAVVVGARRYVEGELRHLFDDADLEALIVHRRFAGRVATIAPEGERVVAPRPGCTPTLEALPEFCRTRLAAYKLPRGLVLEPKLERSPAGKADYRWARARASHALVEPT